MWKWLLIVFIALVGSGTTIQGAVNTRLSTALALPVASALVNFTVGAALLALLTLSGLLGKAHWGGFAAAPWWAYIGGILGAVFVTTTILALPRVGVVVTFATVICGQLIGAAILDSTGWLGVTQISLNVWRIAGLVFLVIGVVLVQRGSA